jgi:hypothetical protein
LIAELVKYFQDKYTHLEVHSVWLIEKSRENDGFQGWHREFYLGTEVTMTIVVNVGAVTKNQSFVRIMTLANSTAESVKAALLAPT